jgi:hypothetical protein
MSVNEPPPPKTELLGFVERLRTPAPKGEKTGFIAVVAFPAILVLPLAGGLIVGALDRGRLGTTAIAWLVFTLVAACLIGFAAVKRDPWAYWVLFAALWLTWLFYVWVAAASPGLRSPDAARDAWWAIFDLLLVPYLYRRRWWFGVDVPLSVPEKTPAGGRVALFLVSLIGTLMMLGVCRGLQKHW